SRRGQGCERRALAGPDVTLAIPTHPHVPPIPGDGLLLAVCLPRRTPGRVQRFHHNRGRRPGTCLPCPVVLAFRQEGCRIPPFAGEHELLEGFALPWSQVALLEIVRQRGGITFVADRNSGPCLVAFRDSKDFARLVGMEDVLAQPRRWNRRNGSLCR